MPQLATRRNFIQQITAAGSSLFLCNNVVFSSTLTNSSMQNSALTTQQSIEKKWWHKAVVYQVYPRSFLDTNGDGVGDLPGVIAKLGYLHQLGVNVIWLSPVYKSPMDDNGYDISDYQDIAPEFGTLADMDRLIAEANKLGIKIIMDLVVNHTSDEHPWFIEAKKSKDNPYRDYYIWRPAQPDGSPPDDRRATFGGSVWELDKASGEYFYHHFSVRQPDLNWQNPKVRQAIYAMMNWWLDRGIGGFRMDVIGLIGKNIEKKINSDPTRLHPLVQEMHRETFGGRDVLTVGETWGATPDIAKLYSDPARKELSMVFQFEIPTMMYDAKEGKWKSRPFEFAKFKSIINKWQVELRDVGWNSLFWNNHDLPRAVSKYGDTGAYRVASAKMLANLLHFLKGTPYVYQGEEIGMTDVRYDSIDDYRDIETLNLYKERTAAGVSHQDMMEGIYQNSRDDSRTPMQWDRSKHAGFSTGTPWLKVNTNADQINVAADLQRSDSIFKHYQQLIRLRQQMEIMVYGVYASLLDSHPDVLAYQRTWGKQKLVCINNFFKRTVTLDVPAELHNIEEKGLISNYGLRHKLAPKIKLAPYESFVILYDQS
jgi:oligo-1,6-glucosidase